MKRKIFFSFLIFILIFLQTTSSFSFNLPLFFLFLSLLFLPKDFSLFLAIFTGFLLDLFSEKPFYFFTFISILIFFFNQFLIKKYVKI